MLKCIALDDEEISLEIIDEYCKKIDQISLIGKFDNAVDALAFIKDNDVDLVFLDVQMPDINGFEFMELLEKTPMIIMTTAHNKYALRSYEFKTMDYLQKPISFARFLKSIEKIVSFSNTNNPLRTGVNPDKTSYIFVQSNGKTVRIDLNEILYIKGMNDYIVVHTQLKKIIVKDSLRHASDLLIGRGFVRIHKSFIVSIDKVDVLSGTSLMINNDEIPIGKNYREELQSIIQKNKIG